MPSNTKYMIINMTSINTYMIISMSLIKKNIINKHIINVIDKQVQDLKQFIHKCIINIILKSKYKIINVS